MQLNFNNQQMAHILSEIIVFIGITFYFSTRIKNIEKKITLQNNRINDLEETVTNQKKIIKLILAKLQDDYDKKEEENLPEKINENVEKSSIKSRTDKFVDMVSKNKKNKPEPKIVEIEDEDENEDEKKIVEIENEEDEDENDDENDDENENDDELIDDDELESMISDELKNLT